MTIQPTCRDADRMSRRARLATAAAFLLTGLVFATWAARIPARKAELGLSDAQLAVGFVGLNAGAVIGLQLGGMLVTRCGSRRVIAVGLPVFGGMLLPLAYASDLLMLTIALAASALANSVIDVAINDQAVAVQQRYGRSLLAGMHAMHSLGGVLGGGLAAVAAGRQVAVGSHFGCVAGLVTAVSVITSRTLLPPAAGRAPTNDQTGRVPLFRGWTARLLVLGGAAFLVTLADGSALDWGAVLLADTRADKPAGGAAAGAGGLAIYQVALTVGRLSGDRIIDRLGPTPVFTGAAVLAGTGFGLGLLVGTDTSATLGLAALGAGLAPLLPICISAAGAGHRLPVPVAVARVSMVGYLGSFTGPVLIGSLAHHSSLPMALLLPAAAVLMSAAAAPATRASAAR